MKHSKTSRTLKTNASVHTLELGISKRTISRASNLTIQKIPRKLSSPQKQLKNWCKIQQSLLHNIYDLKQLKPDENDYATVAKYQEGMIKIQQLEDRLKEAEMMINAIKGQLMMMEEDKESWIVRNIDLVSEMEELEEIIEVYKNKFPQQSSTLFKLLANGLGIRQTQNQISKVQSQIQDLSQAIPTPQPAPSIKSTNHLNHRIHTYRLQLLQLQHKLNDSCQSISKPLLRQILCHFYIANKQNKQNDEIGIELWVCKNSLVNSLDKYIYSNNKYLKQQFLKQYLEYLQVLTKIEMNYIEIERINTISQADNFQNMRLSQKKFQLSQLKQKLIQLNQQKQTLQQELNNIWSNEQLFRLQCDKGQYDTKILLSKIKTQQIKRNDNMRSVKLRYDEIINYQENNKSYINPSNIQDLKQIIAQKQALVDLLKYQICQLTQQQNKKHYNFSSSRVFIQKEPQHLDEEIEALQKKLVKLQEKKQTIINSKFHETPRCQKPILKQINSNLVSPSKNRMRRKSKANSKSATKINKQQTTYHTIKIKPYEPLDKAINKLVSFKKTLANDKLKLNKQMNKLMKNI